MSVVVDASTAVKWYIPEILSSQAVELLALAEAGSVALLAPDMVLAEIGEVLRQKLKRKEMDGPTARYIAEVVTETFPASIAPTQELLPAALEIAAAFDRPLAECLYLALAEQWDTFLVTADEEVARVYRGTFMDGRVKWLGDREVVATATRSGVVN
ncbi:MAG: type II toxin-antitoxin system VapC family toxin [Peptococcaceae bacterium]|jgi:predicted nucleic acid-binding protein|nr:type II toxin-antitoxin system VapC family toxin [Peptococcaceae bacterium]